MKVMDGIFVFCFHVTEESFPVCAKCKSLEHHSPYTAAITTLSAVIIPEEMG
jgi:hypothetical protein